MPTQADVRETIKNAARWILGQGIWILIQRSEDGKGKAKYRFRAGVALGDDDLPFFLTRSRRDEPPQDSPFQDY